MKPVTIKASLMNLTDRAHRYRANANPPEGKKQCHFCGVKKHIEIGHVNGHEEDGSQENLIYTCRACNVRCANTLSAAGLGRKTRQYNPNRRKKRNTEGAKTLGQWTKAILSMRGITNDMPVDEAVAIIYATPASRRSSFNEQLWNNRKARR